MLGRQPVGTCVRAVAGERRHRRGLRRLLWAPNELGVARAYVSGDIDIEGDLLAGLDFLEQMSDPNRGPGVRTDAEMKKRCCGWALSACHPGHQRVVRNRPGCIMEQLNPHVGEEVVGECGSDLEEPSLRGWCHIAYGIDDATWSQVAVERHFDDRLPVT